MSELADPLELQTERPGVVLRQLKTHADDVAYQDSYDASRPEIHIFDPDAYLRHRTVEVTEQARLSGDAAGILRMGVWDGSTFVGSQNARPQPDGSIEIGYWADSRQTGKHYMSLGAAALAAFLSQSYQRVFAEIREDNVASIHVIENAGLSLSAHTAPWLTYELIGQRACPFPSLEGAERTVENGDYRTIDGSDATLLLSPDDLDVMRKPGQYYPELLPGIRMRGLYSAGSKGLPIVSFLYNKLDSNGRRERDQRVIIVEGIGYGVHAGHIGQPPSWYLIGPKVGTVNHTTGEFQSAIQLPAEVSANNYSIACITNGPFGVPLLANPERLQAAN